MLKNCLLSILILFLISHPSVAQAQNVAPVNQSADCKFDYQPVPNRLMDSFNVNVSSARYSPGTEYKLVIEYPSTTFGEVSGRSTGYFDSIDFQFTGTSGQSTGSAAFSKRPIDGWYTGEYKLFLVEKSAYNSISSLLMRGFSWLLPIPVVLHSNIVRVLDRDAVCKATFKIADNTQAQSKCDIHVLTKPIDPGTNVELQITGIAPSDDKGGGYGGYDINIDNKHRKTYSTSEGEKVSIGTTELGVHRISITDRCGFLATSCAVNQQLLQCPERFFKVGEYGKNEGGELTSQSEIQAAAGGIRTNPVTAAGTYCQTGSADSGISTAIGCIRTDPELLIKDLFRLAMGIGGGIAFLMMVYGSFQMITSAGNADAVKAGRERFESAIIGLVFIIFSIFILRFIGVDILGFGELFGVATK